MADKPRRKTWGPLGPASLVAGHLGLLLGGFAAMGAGFVGVVLGIFGTRRTQWGSLAGLVLGLVVLGYAGLFGLGLLSPPLEEDRRHLIRSLDWFNRAYGHIDAENLQGTELSSMLHTALEEARRVDADRIEARIPGFAVRFDEDYRAGLELMIQGVDTGDREALVQAGLLLDRWAVWSDDRRDALERVGREIPPLAAFIGIV
ncbi:MAG: hypothetical protein K9M82_02515 [Deltaproteobacteria bacterium]|nr:hypothetical protein [Deltaproteobacteria bacterium]